MHKSFISLALATMVAMATAAAAEPSHQVGHLNADGEMVWTTVEQAKPAGDHDFITREGIYAFIAMRNNGEISSRFNTVEYQFEGAIPTYYLVVDQNEGSRRLVLQVLPLLRQGMTNVVIIPIGLLGSDNPEGLAAEFLANAGSIEYLQAWAEGAIPDASKATADALAKIQKNNTTAIRGLHLADAPVRLKYDPNEKDNKFSFGANVLGWQGSTNHFDLTKWPNKAWTAKQIVILQPVFSKKSPPKLTPYVESDLTDQVCTKQGQCWKALPKEVATAAQSQSAAPSGGQKALKVLLDIFRP